MVENNIVLNKRIVWIDIVKLLAILLVLIGHFIQIYDPNYRKSDTFLFINSFHMPLFMIISGYFLTWNKLTEWGDILRKRFMQLILPSIFWLLIIAFVQDLLGISKPLFQVVWFGLWFLKSLFVCILILVMAATLKKNRILSIAVAVLISQLTVFVPHLWFLQIFTMLPCIVCGIFLKRIVNRGNNQLLVITSVNLLIFIALNVFWGGGGNLLFCQIYIPC